MQESLHSQLSIKTTSKTCAVAVIERDGRVLTGLRHYTPDKWKDITVWTLPGGRADEGETVEQTLRREVAEEVGITELEIKDFIGEAGGAKDGDHVFMFYCTTDQDARLMEPEKFSEWRWMTKDEYKKVVEQEYDRFNPVAGKIIIEYLSNLE